MSEHVFILAYNRVQAKAFAKRRDIKDFTYVGRADKLRGQMGGTLYLLDGYYKHYYAYEALVVAEDRGMTIERVDEDEG